MAAVLVRFVIFAKRVLFWVENHAISGISVLNPIFLPKMIIDMATNHYHVLLLFPTEDSTYHRPH